MPLLDLASDAQQDRYLADVATGALLSAALNEPGHSLPERPAVNFADGKLNGTKIGVPYAETAKWLVVTTDQRRGGGLAHGRRCDGHQDPDRQRLG
ncbi:acyl-CoA dehydrogenase [Mycolicibacterium fortuitum]|uniref:Acyl-CoA dehydrogenase n=1 Tax=Mycolicibacterium fortuitum TaxID=1766 RepID=A0A378UWT8_MYCFO|nr:acyl-CoA dehydrogenase [Mycolicibacterium fortuitum]